MTQIALRKGFGLVGIGAAPDAVSLRKAAGYVAVDVSGEVRLRKAVGYAALIEAEPSEGSAAVTLADIQQAASGTVTVTGTAAGALAALVSAASGITLDAPRVRRVTLHGTAGTLN